MSNYNFNNGYNLKFLYFGRQLVAVKATYFLHSITGSYWTLNNWSREKTLQLILFTKAEPGETLKFEGNKINCFPREHSFISDLL